MIENRWNDERFIKCNNCKKGLIVFPLLGQKYFKCKYCGTKIKNKEYYKFGIKRSNKWEKEKKHLDKV